MPIAAPQQPAALEDLSAASAIVFDNVSIAFQEHPVLDGISFHLAQGETKALFGVAGSGKSIILKLALGLIKPDAGRIWVLGEEVSALHEQDLFELRRRIGMVFQESALFDSFTVRDNVAFRLLEEGKIGAGEIERRVSKALSFVELEHTMDMFPGELSGGMRRRVAIARAMINQPEVLLYDSPTGGLDPVTSTTIIELLVKQRDIYNSSSLLVTHRLQDAFTMASHYFDGDENKMLPLPPGKQISMSFLVLREGHVIFDGSAHDLARSRDEYIREYIS